MQCRQTIVVFKLIIETFLRKQKTGVS